MHPLTNFLVGSITDKDNGFGLLQPTAVRFKPEQLRKVGTGTKLADIRMCSAAQRASAHLPLAVRLWCATMAHRCSCIDSTHALFAPAALPCLRHDPIRRNVERVGSLRRKSRRRLLILYPHRLAHGFLTLRQTFTQIIRRLAAAAGTDRDQAQFLHHLDSPAIAELCAQQRYQCLQSGLTIVTQCVILSS